MDRDDRDGLGADEDRDGVVGETEADSTGSTQPDDPTDPDLAPPAAPALGRVPPVNRAMARVGQRFGGRSVAVYGVLLAGAFVLLILLAIVWFSADDDDDDDVPGCFDTSPGEAVAVVKDGQIEGVSIVSPQSDDEEIDGDLVLPAMLKLDLADGTCRNLQPQGPSGELDMYTVLGAVEWYNRNTEQRRIEIDVVASDNIPAEILATVTPVPTPTVPVSETPVDAATPAAETPTATPEPTATPIAPVEVSPLASPDASPVASPVP